ncbi:glycosyltransferase [Biomphalaria pfeifferi]|uniref:Glycosyltransferase n=1 Tax=Biomphalaria pfeifferi TaxID=112525 RepID=A0AAD8AMW4_BIOPF|nr:glycosyltransferase [Biomphalaria pfeifferi]
MIVRTDQTLEKLNELFGQKENFRIIRHEMNQGVAAGIMTGIKAANTDIVCSMDCDLHIRPARACRNAAADDGKRRSRHSFALSREGGRTKRSRMAFVLIEGRIVALPTHFALETFDLYELFPAFTAVHRW